MTPDNGRGNIARGFGALFISAATGIMAHHLSFAPSELLSLMALIFAGAFCLTAKVR